MAGERVPSVALFIDERFSRERKAIFVRDLANASQKIRLELLTAASEEEALKQLQSKPYDLVLAPWANYFKWARVEAHFGATRTSGPTFAGYLSELTERKNLFSFADRPRGIVIDLSRGSPPEITAVLRALAFDQTRSGIRPLLDAGAVVRYMQWHPFENAGKHMDPVLALGEVRDHGWWEHAHSIRICLSSLHSLVYDGTRRDKKAYFEFAADRSSLLLRLIYSAPGKSQKEILRDFWPSDDQNASVPAQLLLRVADFVRVHPVAGTTDVELTIGFFKSASHDSSMDRVKTLWVEPLAATLFAELPAKPGTSTQLVQPISETPTATAAPGEPEKNGGKIPEKAKDRLLFEAAAKIRELKGILADRDGIIRELRSGGVGTAQPLPPPDVEALLEAFQTKYFEARFEIHQIERQIAEMVAGGQSPTAKETEALKQKMAALLKREQSWILKLGAVLEAYRQARQKNSGSGGA